MERLHQLVHSGQLADTWPWLLLPTLVVTCWLMFRAHRRLGRRPSLRAGSKRRARQPALPAQAKSDGQNRWEVEMHETARTLKGELDHKLGLLQQLILEADRVAARLETAVKTTEAEAPTNDGSDEPRYAEIFQLADAGLDTAAIARQVHSTQGEIDLILNLRRGA